MSENAFSLIVSIPGEEPARHDLTGDSATFGRSPENDIQILVAEVSVRHGRLVRDGGGAWRVVDPGSTNGTQVNGQRVGPEGVALNPMDRLLLGTVVPAWFVPSTVLAATPLADLVASLQKVVKEAGPKTAPVAVAVAATPVVATPGGTTVKLDQVRKPGGPPVPGVAPGVPPGVPPGVAPKPLQQPLPGVAPLKPPAPDQALRPPTAAPPAPGTAPSAPTIPLPKKPGQ